LQPTHKIEKTSDPFKNDLPDTTYSKIKFVLLTPLAIVRGIMFIVFLLLGGFFGVLASLGAPQDMKTSWPFWRRILASPISPLARCLLFSIGFHWIEIDDRQKTKAQTIVIGPHTALMDSFFITYYFLPSPISKSVVRDIPVFGSLCIALQTIFVDRESSSTGPYSRKNVIEAMNLRAKDRRFPRMCIFPEGTTTNGNQLMVFKKGAFSSKEPVTPMLLTYPNKYYNCACAGRNGTDLSLVWCMFEFFNRMKVTILDAYVPSEEEKNDPDLYAENVRKYMGQELGLPSTEHSYPDLFLQMEGAKDEYFYDCDFTCEGLKREYGLELDALKAILRRFMTIDKLKIGGLAKTDLYDALGCREESEEYKERLFGYFADDGEKGMVTMRCFLQVLGVVGSKNIDDALGLAYCIADKSCTGVSWEDIKAVLGGEEHAGKRFEGRLGFEDFKEMGRKGDGGELVGRIVSQGVAEKVGITFEKAKEEAGALVLDV
jgi:lysophosphatidylcholine acyltransferase/lyso-PAF acetyltransferase